MVKHQAKTPSEEISSDLEGMLLVMHQDSHVLDRKPHNEMIIITVPNMETGL